jgi:small subunit ribosomal protein S4
MSIHKIRPKFKKYAKAGIFLGKQKKTTRLKKPALNFFSPDLIYLNSKLSYDLKNHFQVSSINRRKLKLLFGFQRTSLLKRYLKKELSANTRSQHSLKEMEFCSLLERRLDFLLYRLGFAATLFEAKHLISHKKLRINGRSSSSFSRFLKKGDVISFLPSIEGRIKKRLIEQLHSRDHFFGTFYNVEVNFRTLKIVVLTEKVNLSQQVQHYPFSLHWNILGG